MATIVITGGTGLIGRALTETLEQKGNRIIIFTRGDEESIAGRNIFYTKWDVKEQYVDLDAIAQADYIIHLAGASVMEKRWTNKRRKEIVDSRVKSSELLVNAIRQVGSNLKAVISASAIGWYGPDTGRNEGGFKESDPAANDFLGQTCLQWENAIGEVKKLGKRLVRLRTGIVLSPDGGALKEFITPLRFGIATILGSGKQVISWIHIDDLVSLYIKAMEDERWEGVYNAVSPMPVTNKNFVITLAKERNGKAFIPVHVPSFFLKMYLGESSIEIMKSAAVSSQRVEQSGFSFKYPGINGAIKQIISSDR